MKVNKRRLYLNLGKTQKDKRILVEQQLFIYSALLLDYLLLLSSTLFSTLSISITRYEVVIHESLKEWEIVFIAGILNEYKYSTSQNEKDIIYYYPQIYINQSETIAPYAYFAV